MPISDIFFRPSRNTKLIIGTSVATTLAVITIARLAFHKTPPRIIPSPRESQIPLLSKKEQEDLPYPPDVLPGARDVTSPYGTIRVYEWGPLEGRKVLLVHGISTPCIALGGIANALVERGCRVMLFDLWGRGYSDSVDLPHDSRLYTTEILLAITSSPIAWTPEGFSLIGYSLGGGICADFTAAFPEMVKSLILLAPAGLIPSHPLGWQGRIMYSGLIPDGLLEWIVRRRLEAGLVHKGVQKPTSAETAVNAEIKGAENHSFESASLSKTNPHVTVGAAVQWQVQNHEGFVRSFVSSFKNATLEATEKSWATFGKLGLRKDKVLVFAGKSDPVIIAKELEHDIFKAIGEHNVAWHVIEGGHEFPITRAEDVVREISTVWGI